MNNDMESPGEQLSPDQVLANGRFLGLQEKELVHSYARYLSYRVLWSLYEIAREIPEAGTVTWCDFVNMTSMSQELCDRARKAAYSAVIDFALDGEVDLEIAESHLEFDPEAISEDGDTVYCLTLFAEEQEEALVSIIFLTIEAAAYRKRISSGEKCSWDKFLADISGNHSLWDNLMVSFRDALNRIDFTGAWLDMDADENDVANNIE